MSDSIDQRLTRIEEMPRRHKLVADMCEEIGWLTIDELADLLEYIKALCATRPVANDLMGRE